MNIMKHYKYIRFGILLIIAVTILELTVFNIKSWITLNYKETKVTGCYYYGSSIEVLDINQEVKNIYIDLSIKEEDGDWENRYEKIDIYLSVTDEANKLYFDLPQKAIVSSVERTKYISLNLAGNTEKITINILDDYGKDIRIKKIILNKKIPFHISLPRMLIVLSILLITYYIRPKSRIWKEKVNLTKTWQRIVLCVLVVVNIFIFYIFVNANPDFTSTYGHHLQYEKLTDALLKGQFYLDDEPPQVLLDMENPYDTGYRDYLMAENKQFYNWDHAYYNEKYYVYFGITPVLLFYLPSKLLTGEYIHVHNVIFISSILFIISVILLMYEMVKKWFKDIPFITFVIMSFLIINGSAILYAIARPDFYSIPFVLGMALSICGLYFWISSIKEDQEDLKIKTYKLFFGSFCMALIAGTRPQMLIVSFFAIPIFWNAVIKHKKFFSRHSIKSTILFIIPYIVFGFFIMYYNASRFGSPFDFGVNYNLTTNDMTRRGFHLGRTGLGLFTYLFQPPVITAEFPYIKSVYIYTAYQGRTIVESMYGGVFICHVMLCINFFIFKIKSLFQDKLPYMLACMSFLFSIIIVIVDTQMAGILYRYYMDFTLFLWLSASILVFAIFNKSEVYNDKRIFRLTCTVFIACVIISSLYNSASLIFQQGASIRNTNPKIFYSIKHVFEFWM